MIYMIIGDYFEDDASDELTNDPVFKSVLEKDALASRPMVSRFFNRMDEDTLNQFLAITRVRMSKMCESRVPEKLAVLLDKFRFHVGIHGKHILIDKYYRLLFWIWIPLFLMHTADRKAEPLTFTIRAMVIIHLSVMME